MKKATKANINRLGGMTGNHMISMFVPLHAGPENHNKDSIVLKQALSGLQKKLLGVSNPKKDKSLARIVATANNAMLKRVDGTMCFFDNLDSLTTLHTSTYLPVQVYVGKSFVVKELTDTLPSNAAYFVLTLSQQAVHLYKGTVDTIQNKTKISNTIKPMLRELHIDELNTAINTHPTGTGGKKGSHGFHGYGSLQDQRKDLIEEYFRKIDSRLSPILKQSDLPLILAGVEFLLPIYRKVSKYKNIAREEIHGNMDHITQKKLLTLVQTLS